METEAAARPSNRPRPVLLAALGVAIAAYAYTLVSPGNSAPPTAGQSNPPRSQAAPKTAKGGGGPVDPGELKVRIEDLSASHPDPDKAGRNPFKFYTAPLAPPPTPTSGPGSPNYVPPPPGPPPPPPGPPPIPLKFIGVLETKPGQKLAAFSDCQKTWRGREGDIVAGQYRLLKIGVESVTMEYLDHRGQQTIRMTGQECIGRQE